MCLPDACIRLNGRAIGVGGGGDPRAEQLGLVPKAVQGDWQQPITRGEFAVLAIRYLALEYGYTEDAAFVNDYMTLMPDRNGEFWGEEDFGDGLTWWERFADDEGHFYLTDLPQGEQRGYINSAYFIGIVNGKGGRQRLRPRRAPLPGRRRPACWPAAMRFWIRRTTGQALYSEYGDYGRHGRLGQGRHRHCGGPGCDGEHLRWGQSV